VPGAVFAAVRGRQQVISAAGVLNVSTGQPVTIDSLFQIGSITKAYTATMLHQLADEGLINLEDRLDIWLPEFCNQSGGRFSGVTLLQLLNHTSGLDGDCFVDTGRGDDCVQAFLPRAAQLTALHKAGDEFSYCNTGYVLAGCIIEKVTGCSWHEALSRRILTPLGVARTLVLPEDVMRHSFAVGHLKSGTGRQVSDPLLLPRSNEPAGSTPWSDMAGLLAFAQAHLNDGQLPGNGRLLSAESAHRMRTRDIDCPPFEAFSGWGAGWAVFDWGNGKFFGHDGLTRGQAAFLRIDPESGLIIAMFANGGDMRGLFMELADSILEEELGISAPEDFPQTTFGGDLHRYCGTYGKFSDALILSETVDGLHLQVQPRNDPVGIVKPLNLTLTGLSETLFTGTIPGSSAPLVLNFSSFDPNGRPRRVHMHLRAYNREA